MQINSLKVGEAVRQCSNRGEVGKGAVGWRLEAGGTRKVEADILVLVA